MTKSTQKPTVENSLVIYRTKQGVLELQGDVTNETIWASQAQMASIFNVQPQNITIHLRNIFSEGELEKDATCKESLQVQIEGTRSIFNQFPSTISAPSEIFQTPRSRKAGMV